MTPAPATPPAASGGSGRPTGRSPRRPATRPGRRTWPGPRTPRPRRPAPSGSTAALGAVATALRSSTVASIAGSAILGKSWRKSGPCPWSGRPEQVSNDVRQEVLIRSEVAIDGERGGLGGFQLPSGLAAGRQPRTEGGQEL